jgi:hypothetical protein
MRWTLHEELTATSELFTGWCLSDHFPLRLSARNWSSLPSLVTTETLLTIRCIAVAFPQLLQRCVIRRCLETVFYCCAIAWFVVGETCLAREQSCMRDPISRLSGGTSQYIYDLGVHGDNIKMYRKSRTLNYMQLAQNWLHCRTRKHSNGLKKEFAPCSSNADGSREMDRILMVYLTTLSVAQST